MIRTARLMMSNSIKAGLFAALMMLLVAGAAPVSGQTNPPAEQKQEASQAPSPTPPTGPAEPSREGQIMAPTATPEVPGGEGFKFRAYEGHADIEVGYRWVSDVAGVTGVSSTAKDVYRSMVNLGSGPKLLRSNISLRSNYGSGGLFDRMDISANNWGGDPYNTVRLNVSLSDKYEFRADYRNLNYYNFLPEYANPLLLNGVLFGQHSLDTTYRSTNLELRLFPNNSIRPFVGYTRASGFGPGFSTIEFTGNEFLVGTNWQYSSDDYRGGVELSLPKTTLIVEQGYRLLRNDTSLESGPNAGNNPGARFLGVPVNLSGGVSTGYHDRTSLPYTKLVAKFAPFRSLKVSGRYIYSMADLDSAFAEVSSGSLVTLTERLVYSAGLENNTGTAKRPNHNGAFLVEFSPVSRLTLTDQFDTRNTHTSGSAILASVFLGSRSLSGPGTGPTRDVSVSDVARSLLSFNRLQNLAEAEFDVGYGFALRAGYRYRSGDATVGDTEADDPLEPDSSSYTQHTGIAGFVYRRARWLRVGLDYEKNDTKGSLTRTDLLNSDQVRLDWRLGSWKHFSTSGRIYALRNKNPQSDIDLRAHNRNYSFELNYDPSERLNFSVDYSKSSIFSDILVLLPQSLQFDRSLFDERTHGIGGSVGVGVYRGARVDFGYRGISNSGNNALNYHQPFASLSIPLPNRLAFKTYWQYFGYNEKDFFGRTLVNNDPRGSQDFRVHLLTFSIAYAY